MKKSLNFNLPDMISQEVIDSLIEELFHFSEKNFDEILSVQRELHAIPELGFREFKTHTYIRNYLEDLGYEVESYDEYPTTLIARLQGNVPGKAVAIRCELDAIEVEEATGFPHTSGHSARMHACGHDYHMAVVMGLAKFFRKVKDKIPGKIIFLFQPAEEPAHSGAPPLVAKGLLKDIDIILGFHNNPALEAGTVEMKEGMVSSGITHLKILMRGRGGHTSRPDLTDDLIMIAAGLITNLFSLVKQSFDPRQPVSLAFGQIHSGDSDNVIPGELFMTGTLRITDESVREGIVARIREYIKNYCAMHGIEVEIETHHSAPGVRNSPELIESVSQSLQRTEYSQRIIRGDKASMGGEDFSFYTEKIPGILISIGSRPETGEEVKLHSPTFHIDDSFIVHGIRILGISLINLLFKS